MRHMRFVIVALVVGFVAACGAGRSPVPDAEAGSGSGSQQMAQAPLAAKPAASPEAEPVAFDRAGFDAFLAELRSEALQKGIKPAVLDTALTGIEPVMRIIQRDRNQAEFKLTFSTYRDRVITPANVARGQKLRDDHHAILQQVAQRYGVQPRFILAIWGIETRYGAVRSEEHTSELTSL